MNVSRKIMVASFVFCLAIALCVGDALAQRGGGGRGEGGRGGGRQGGNGGANGRFGGGAAGGGIQFLLRRDDVKKELDLSEEQIEKLEDLGGNRDREGMREMMQELRELDQDERRERMREIMNERTAKVEEQLNDILLPHQMKRLKQISFQSSARGARSLTRGRVADELELTDEQKEKLAERAEELQKEFNEKVAKMREEMQEELIGELTSDQQKKYKELMGDSFKFEQLERGQRGGAGAGGRRQGGGQQGGGRQGGGRRGGRGGEGGGGRGGNDDG